MYTFNIDCVDVKAIGMLMRLQFVLKNYCFLLCIWDSRAIKED